jgi:hypothetical protein
MSGFVSVHKKGSVKLSLTLGGIDAGFPCRPKIKAFRRYPPLPSTSARTLPSLSAPLAFYETRRSETSAMDSEREATRRLLLCRNDACYTLLVAIKRGMLPLASKPCKEAKTNRR